MGGLLEPYNDVGKGWRINKPSGWVRPPPPPRHTPGAPPSFTPPPSECAAACRHSQNQFDTLPGVYEMKWEDLVATNREVLLVATTPVKSTTTSVDMLGDVTEVGRKLGKGKKELLSAKAVEKEGACNFLGCGARGCILRHAHARHDHQCC